MRHKKTEHKDRYEVNKEGETEESKEEMKPEKEDSGENQGHCPMYVSSSSNQVAYSTDSLGVSPHATGTFRVRCHQVGGIVEEDGQRGRDKEKRQQKA